MKVLQTVVLILVFSLVASCSSDDDSSDENLDPVTQPFFVKINGQDFLQTSITTVDFGDTINIEAVNANDVDIVLGFPKNLATGESLQAGVFNSNGTDVFVAIYDTDGDGFIATSGQLTIVSHNLETKEISGRFNFSGPNFGANGGTLDFTEGEFIVNYGIL
ncbi:hypothetical protein [Psychroserpens sp.]|uniref:hypothetical protein n=1 Tax=Psychroserpens sp. TaxID=2020870 RepID=UPI003C728CFE